MYKEAYLGPAFQDMKTKKQTKYILPLNLNFFENEDDIAIKLDVSYRTKNT